MTRDVTQLEPHVRGSMTASYDSCNSDCLFAVVAVAASAYSGGLGVGALQPGAASLGPPFGTASRRTRSVQSLSFVLTLPIFITIMMMIVQVSQFVIGQVVVQYAAFAAARSAAVWIPAAMADPEGPCCISSYSVDPDAPDQVPPELNPNAADYGPGSGGQTYKIEPGSPKFDKIASAAILACVPISPSRDMGLSEPSTAQMDSVMKDAYATLAP